MAQELAAELRELFSETEVHVDPLSLSVACHIGPGSAGDRGVEET